MLQNATQKASLFYCQNCDYKCSKKIDYNRHLATDKHKNAIFMLQNATQKSAISNYPCTICNKIFKHSSSMYRHKKTCEQKDKQEEKPELVDYLLKENSELKTMIKEICKTQIAPVSSTAVTNNNNNTQNITNSSINSNNNNNNTFNLQFFLNETCKDAINISDFIESIELQLSDLEETGQVGYVQGISNIIKKTLREIETSQRPMHCSDLKREVMYVKNANKWIKETDEKSTIAYAIKQIANKNIKQISEWTKNNPGYNDPSSKKNDKYLRIVLNSMSGSTVEEQQTNMNKIISNIAKEVAIEK